MMWVAMRKKCFSRSRCQMSGNVSNEFASNGSILSCPRDVIKRPPTSSFARQSPWKCLTRSRGERRVISESPLISLPFSAPSRLRVSPPQNVGLSKQIHPVHTIDTQQIACIRNKFEPLRTTVDRDELSAAIWQHLLTNVNTSCHEAFTSPKRSNVNPIQFPEERLLNVFGLRFA